MPKNPYQDRVETLAFDATTYATGIHEGIAHGGDANGNAASDYQHSRNGEAQELGLGKQSFSRAAYAALRTLEAGGSEDAGRVAAEKTIRREVILDCERSRRIGNYDRSL